ncbi:hypothetical protein [Pseudomonas putida]|uniref:hypothetical protein n=1 Tax=Pseudomonas putida TaxID=303 RepID=UPI000CD418E2|nr:hypothetical protein [Pseudomonas putida]POF93211.1 hypothetical protein BGP83_11115 [Pseudomonas putida]
MNEFAQWLGYGVMATAALAVIALVLFLLAYICVRSTNKGIKALMYRYDLATLRKTMRQLEAEGKVRRKEVAND